MDRQSKRPGTRPPEGVFRCPPEGLIRCRASAKYEVVCEGNIRGAYVGVFLNTDFRGVADCQFGLKVDGETSRNFCRAGCVLGSPTLDSKMEV